MPQDPGSRGGNPFLTYLTTNVAKDQGGNTYAPGLEEPPAGPRRDAEGNPFLTYLGTNAASPKKEPTPAPVPQATPPGPGAGVGVSAEPSPGDMDFVGPTQLEEPQRLDWLGPFRGELGEDYQIPLTETVAGWHAGANGINVMKLREDLLSRRTANLLLDLNKELGRMPTAEEFDPHQRALTEKTFRDMQLLEEHARGLQRARGPEGIVAPTLIDHDPTGKNLALRGWVRGADAPGSGWTVPLLNAVPTAARRWVAPLAAGAMGTQMIVSDPNAPVGEESTYNDGQDALSFVDWGSRTISPLTYYSVAARAGGAGVEKGVPEPEGPSWEGAKAYASALPTMFYGIPAAVRGWGTDEALILHARGEEVFTLSDELQLQYASVPLWVAGEAAEAVGEAMGYDTKGFGEGAGQGGAAFMVSLLEPDPWLGAAGLGAKGVQKATPWAAKALGMAAETRAAARAASALRLQDEMVAATGLATEEARLQSGWAAVEDYLRGLPSDQRQVQEQLILAALPKMAHFSGAVQESAQKTLDARKAARKAMEEMGAPPDLLDEAIQAKRAARDEAIQATHQAQDAARAAKVEMEDLGQQIVGLPPDKGKTGRGSQPGLGGVTVGGKTPDELGVDPSVLEGSTPKLNAHLVEANYDPAQLRALLDLEMAKDKPVKAKMRALEIAYRRYYMGEVGTPKAPGALAAQYADAADTFQASRAEVKTARSRAVQAAQDLTRAQAVRDGYKALMSEAVHHNLVLQTLRSTAESMRKVGAFSGTKAAKLLTQEEEATMIKALQENMVLQADAYNTMIRAGADDFEDAAKVFDDLKREGDKHILTLMRQDAKKAMVTQDAAIKAAEEAAKGAGERLQNLSKQAKNLGVDLEPSLKETLKDFGVELGVEVPGNHNVARKVASRLGQEHAERQPFLAVAAMAGTLGEQYTRIASRASELDGLGSISLRKAASALNDVDLANAVILGEKARQHFTTKGLKRFAVWAENFVKQTMDPVIQSTGMTNTKANGIFASMSNRIALARRSLVHLADPTKMDEVERITNVVNAIDNVGGQDMGSASDMFLRAAYGDSMVPDRSAFDAALPFLREAATNKELGEAAPVLDAIAYSWVASGDSKGFTWLRGRLVEFLKDPPDDLTFQTLMQKMRGFTFQKGVDFKGDIDARMVSGNLAREAPRAYLMGASAVIQAAELSRSMGRMRQAMGDIYTRQHWEAASTLLRGMETDGPEFQRGLALLAELGLTAGVKKAAHSEGKLDLTWIDTGLAEGAIVPRSWIKRANEQIGNIVKLNQPLTTDYKDAGRTTVSKAYREFWRLFNASLITGLIFPRPGHFVNIFVGNMSQVWLEDDMLDALNFGKESVLDLTKLGLQMTKLEGLVPWGKAIDKALGIQEAKFGAGNALPSTTGALLHPVVSMVMDPAKGPAAKKIIGSKGEATIGDLRRWVSDGRILTSFSASSGLARVMRRNANVGPAQKLWDTMTRPQEFWANAADVLEQRQRVMYFTHQILEKGLTPEQAAQRTLNALYDWSYPLAAWEAVFANNIVLFWGFQRRALGQAMQAILEPFSEQGATVANIVQRTAFGSLGAQAAGLAPYRGTRVRDMSLAMKGVEHSMSPSHLTVREDLDGDGDIDRIDQELHSQRAVSPWWLSSPTGSRQHVGNLVMDPYTANMATSQTGVDTNHYAYTIPSLTPLEMINTILGMGGALGGLATQQESVGDVMLDYLAPMGGPVGEEIIKTIARDVFGAESNFKGFTKNGVRVKKPTDKAFAQAAVKPLGDLLGLDPVGTDGLVWQDPNNPGVMRMHPYAWAFYKSLTPVSYEAANYVDAFVQAGWEPTAARAATFFVTQLAGLPKAHMYSAADTLSYAQRDLQEAVGRAKTAEEVHGQDNYFAPSGEVRSYQRAKRDRMMGRDSTAQNPFRYLME